VNSFWGRCNNKESLAHNPAFKDTIRILKQAGAAIGTAIGIGMILGLWCIVIVVALVFGLYEAIVDAKVYFDVEKSAVMKGLIILCLVRTKWYQGMGSSAESWRR
jgi:hypothetical protein